MANYRFLTGLCYPSIQQVSKTDVSLLYNTLVKLTIGDLYKQVLGFINSISINYVDGNSVTWDISKEIPMIITISISFTPISHSHTTFGGVNNDSN